MHPMENILRIMGWFWMTFIGTFILSFGIMYLVMKVYDKFLTGKKDSFGKSKISTVYRVWCIVRGFTFPWGFWYAFEFLVGRVLKTPEGLTWSFRHGYCERCSKKVHTQSEIAPLGWICASCHKLFWEKYDREMKALAFFDSISGRSET
jgi:hypothetical protein